MIREELREFLEDVFPNLFIAEDEENDGYTLYDSDNDVIIFLGKDSRVFGDKGKIRLFADDFEELAYLAKEVYTKYINS